MLRIPEEVIRDILDRSDIVEIIGEHLRLQRRGKNYVGLCPFHSEKAPSFNVNPERQIFYCFGCQVGGNIFKFLMLFENLTFLEAVEKVAARCGIDLPKVQLKPEQRRRQKQNEELYEYNALVRDFFREQFSLGQGRKARDYLRDRGVNNNTIEQFQVGYAPGGWEMLVSFAQRKKLKPAYLEKLGLIIRKDKGGHYDRFRDRLMFPIHDLSDHVVGFGGRSLDDSEPKYMNSPESDVFVKNRLLYGLNFARDSIRRQDIAVLVEGYTDVIAMHQHGVNNVVATLGTALSSSHIRLLKRYTGNVTTFFDADDAGIRATIRGMKILLDEKVHALGAIIPEGHDPDSYIRSGIKPPIGEVVENSRPLVDYFIELVIKRGEASSIRGRMKILEEVIPVLCQVQNGTEQAMYISQLSRRLELPQADILAAMRKFLQNGRKKRTVVLTEKNILAEKLPPEELSILSYIFASREFIDYELLEEIESYADAEISRKLARGMLSQIESLGSLNIQTLDMYLDPEEAEILPALEMRAAQMAEDEDMINKDVFTDSIKSLRQKGLRKTTQQIKTLIKEAEKKNDVELATKLFSELQEVKRQYSN
jgi:DNA primase